MRVACQEACLADILGLFMAEKCKAEEQRGYCCMTKDCSFCLTSTPQLMSSATPLLTGQALFPSFDISMMAYDLYRDVI
jgi:hypothetical protein